MWYVCTPVRIKLSHSWQHKFSATLSLSFRKQLPTFRRTVVSCLLGWSSARTDLRTFREGITHLRNDGNYFHQSAQQKSPNDFNLHRYRCQGFKLRFHLFLILSGAFAKLRKATISFVAYVCLQGKLCSHWTFHEIRYLSIFRKSVRKIQLSLKSDKNKGHFTWRPVYIYGRPSLNYTLEWEMFQKKVVEKINTYTLYAIFIFENRAFFI
jgi:hypothetical protein